MKISVALGSYNGARYIREQLSSIASQERLPDELVVCDDGSSDGTMEIVREFAGAAPFPVHAHLSSENLGCAKNFEKALALCQGDVIALADQDDVWWPHKLRVVEDRMQREPDAAFLFTDADIVGEDLSPLGYRLWEVKAFSPSQRNLVRQGRTPEVLLRYNVVTGATMAIRSEFRELFLPISAAWIHDGWIALVLSMFAPCIVVEEALIRYRQHAAQQVGERRLGFFEKLAIARQQGLEYFREAAERYEAIREHIRGLGNRAPDPRWMRALEEKALHFRNRAAMRQGTRSRRLPWILRELSRLRYSRYAYGWQSLAQDIFL